MEFILLYWKHFGTFDGLIWIIGGAVFGYQVFVWLSIRTGAVAVHGPKFDRRIRQTVSAIRCATLAIDGLPLLGLLGTVAALLVTFAGMTGTKLGNNVIADFAPGLTSTISGIAFALINLLAFNLLLLPAYQRIKGDR